MELRHTLVTIVTIVYMPRIQFSPVYRLVQVLCFAQDGGFSEVQDLWNVSRRVPNHTIALTVEGSSGIGLWLTTDSALMSFLDLKMT